MILPDLNLLIYAYNRDAPHHEAARVWWQAVLDGPEPVALPWAVASGFIRLVTNRRAIDPPWAIADACDTVRAWWSHPRIHRVEAGPHHLDLFEELLAAAGAAGPLTTDAHLAALAIEHGCRLYSNGADFARFPRLVARNPLRS